MRMRTESERGLGGGSSDTATTWKKTNGGRRGRTERRMRGWTESKTDQRRQKKTHQTESLVAFIVTGP